MEGGRQGGREVGRRGGEREKSQKVGEGVAGVFDSFWGASDLRETRNNQGHCYKPHAEPVNGCDTIDRVLWQEQGPRQFTLCRNLVPSLGLAGWAHECPCRSDYTHILFQLKFANVVSKCYWSQNYRWTHTKMKDTTYTFKFFTFLKPLYQCSSVARNPEPAKLDRNK